MAVDDLRIDDAKIRAELCRTHERNADARLVSEWNIGSCRIDLAVIRPSYLHGIEIKSACDTLARLSVQAREYGTVFDVCTLVATREHVAKASFLIPEWWGITEVVPSGKLIRARPRRAGKLAALFAEPVIMPGIMLLERRKPGINPSVDVGALAWRLWNAELRAILTNAALITIRRESKWRMVEIVRRNFTLAQFRPLMIHALLTRRDWRRDVAEESPQTVG